MKKQPQSLIERYYVKYAVQTPYLVYFAVVIIFSSLYLLVSSISINMYTEYIAKVEVQSDSVMIKVDVNDNRLQSMNQHTPVYWYMDKNDRIYQAQIVDINTTGDARQVVIMPNKQDLQNLRNKNLALPEKITVGFKSGEQKLTDRLIKGKGGLQ